MDAGFFLRGLLIGFAIAAPVGPIGVLCIRRTLADGRTTGFVSGLGAATADAAYGAVAGFGLTAVSGFLVRQSAWLRLAGGVFLCYLGLRTFLARPAGRAAETRGSGLLAAYASTLNPMEDEIFFGIITGQQPLDAFDQYVTDWKAGGGDEMTEEANAWYATVK